MKEKKEVLYVCEYCGIEANRLTQKKKYGENFDEERFRLSADIVTCHLGICDICGKEKLVCHVRNFYYPNFNIIKTKLCNDDISGDKGE